MQKKVNRFIKQKDDFITLILHEMKKENGCVEATKKQEKLKKYQNSKLINYVKYFRLFADNKS